MTSTAFDIRMAAPALGDAEAAAVARVIASGRLVQGPEVEAFEEELSASLVAGRPCVAVSSGTSALVVLLAALGIGPGDEVVVPSFTFAATANAVRLVGAHPVFADVRREDFALDPAHVASLIGPRTAAVLTVHLFGQTGAVAELSQVCRRAGVLLLEDAAQAHGATYDAVPAGALADGAALSFYATKNMTTGEGGLVVLPPSGNATLERARMLRNQGGLVAYDNRIVGHNARMTEMAAAIGRVQLTRLPAFTAARRDHAARYAELLAGVLPADALPQVAPGREHVWHQHTVVLDNRDRHVDSLAQQGIETGAFYRRPVHTLPAFAGGESLPVTEWLADRVLALPVHPGLVDADLRRVARAVGPP